MQFHENKFFDLFDLTSFFCLDSLNFLVHCVLEARPQNHNLLHIIFYYRLVDQIWIRLLWAVVPHYAVRCQEVPFLKIMVIKSLKKSLDKEIQPRPHQQILVMVSLIIKKNMNLSIFFMWVFSWSGPHCSLQSWLVHRFIVLLYFEIDCIIRI